jgi:Fe-S oxidoreductase
VQSWIGRLILLAALLASVGFFVREVWIRVQLVKRGKKEIQRTDRPLERLSFMVLRVGSQLCAIKDRPLAGIMHAFVFWGFMLFTVATINHVVGAFSDGFSLWGHTAFNAIWFLGVDIVAVLTIIGALYLAYRRYIVKPVAITQPQPISRSWQSGVVLSFIVGLMITYLFGQAVDGISKGHFFAPMMPFSKASAALFTGLSPAALELWGGIFWWSHILMVFGFLVFIPHSKHLHLLAGPVNIFLRSREPIGTLQKIDFEKSEEFGVSKVTQYQWKTMSDFFSCVDCGRCQDVCPAYQTGKALSPKVVMMSLRKHLLHEKDSLLTGGEPAEPVMDKWLTPEEIWACTTCGACMEACPVMNEHIPAIVELRRAKVMMDSDFPGELNATFRGLETNANPWNMGAAGRAEWSQDLQVPLMAEKGAGSFDDRGKNISQALAQILNAAGVDYAILGAEEKCCGDPARRAGNEYVFQMMADENIQTMKQYKFKKVLTSCPHGYHMIRNEYRHLGGEFEVVHHSELIAQLMEQGRITVRQMEQTVGYHDSCYLGRYNQVYDAPRQIVTRLQAGGCQELGRHHNKSFCCGAGGARMFMEENTGTRINHSRIEEAAASGSRIMTTACPFCLTMLDDGTKEKRLEEKIQVLDIAQVVAQNLAPKA